VFGTRKRGTSLACSYTEQRKLSKSPSSTWPGGDGTWGGVAVKGTAIDDRRTISKFSPEGNRVGDER